MIYEEESRGSFLHNVPEKIPTEISLSRARAAIHLMISRGALVPVAAVKTERPIGQRSIKIPKDITRLPDGEIRVIAEKWRKNLHSTSYDYVSDQAELFILEWDPATTSELVTAAAVVGIPLLLWTIKFWPIWAKIWAWWVFFFVDATLIIVLATAFSVRLVIYAALWPAGIDFWFFPDLIDRDSFTPLYTVERQKIDQRGGRRYNMYNTQELHSCTNSHIPPHYSPKSFIRTLLLRFGALLLYAIIGTQWQASGPSLSDVATTLSEPLFELAEYGALQIEGGEEYLRDNGWLLERSEMPRELPRGERLESVHELETADIEEP